MSFHWPPDYVKLYQWRQQQLIAFRKNPQLLRGAIEYYRTRPVEFICDWVDTYDPRNAGQEGKLTRMPFIMFSRQKELVEFLYACLNGEADGLIEKCRDAGATWISVAVSVHLWLFWDAIAIGWGSRKSDLVDQIGVMDSIFEKIRAVIRGLPREFLPRDLDFKEHMRYMRIINPQTGATITGEAGDNIGRGGRTRIYFKDESAHYERPELIEAALGDNTRVQIDISSVNGIGNVFHRKRENGEEWIPGSEVVHGKTNIFVFDWRDHPEKTQTWYDTRRQKYEDEGMLHLFAQEVDRDYAASVEGVIIKPEWVQAALDAHVKLQFTDDGGWAAGLDVADEGMDKSALVQRKGVVTKKAVSWGQVDVGVTARRALKELVFKDGIFSYDCIGVGAGCKAEFNRLQAMDLEEGVPVIAAGLRILPWNAGGAVLDPEENVIRGDKNSPLNKDHFLNLKAQSWHRVALRFWKTWRAINEGIDYDTEELISIDTSTIPRATLLQLVKELSQATSGLSPGRLKSMINKTPEGTRSPNIADAFIEAYCPVITSRYTLENL